MGKGFEGHVMAGDEPLVMLIGQHCADETVDGAAMSEDTDTVGPAAEPLQRVDRPDLPAVRLWKCVDGEDLHRRLALTKKSAAS